MAKWIVIGLIAAASFACDTHGAVGPSPVSWTKLSDDKKYVLVMIVPWTLSEELSYAHGGLQADPTLAAKLKAIRDRYPASGLYLNDGSRTPIWTIRFVDRSATTIIVDRDHLIFASAYWERDGFGDYDPVASRFFSQGRELASHSVRDLLGQSNDRQGILSTGVVERLGWRLDRVAGEFVLDADDGRSFVFDYRTGKLLRGKASWLSVAGAGILMILLAAGGTFLLLRARLGRNPTEQIRKT